MIALTLLLSLTQASAAATHAPEDFTLRNAAVIRRYYPKSALTRGEEGDVHFEVQLNKKGKLVSCRVLRSSGFSSLDTATCDVLVETAQFKAVRSDLGRTQLSVHEGVISWRIPDDVNSVKSPKAGKQVALNAGDKIVCKRTLRQGSLIVVQKQCLSLRDWQRQVDYAQSATQGMQRPGGDLIY